VRVVVPRLQIQLSFCRGNAHRTLLLVLTLEECSIAGQLSCCLRSAVCTE